MRTRRSLPSRRGMTIGLGLVLLLLLSVSVWPSLPAARAQDAELAQAITEAEPNNTAETAQLLERIGRESPLRGQINPARDVDWYRFEAVEGRTYTVELFNVATSLNGSGGACGSFENGVSMLIFNPLLGTAIAGDCQPRGSVADIHASAQFTADTTGTFYTRMVSFHTTDRRAIGSSE
ncbi:MAG: hypothetical protein AB4911_05090 [Oscillochloridaceae bacterium umkhey_bin13]